MGKYFLVIATKRLVLRQFTDDDLENVFTGLSHPGVIKYYGISFESLEAAKEQLKWFRELEKNKTGIWWAICSKDKNTFCGALGLNDIDKVNKKAEIGIWLLPEFWGKDIMKEVVPPICEYGFKVFDLHRIECFIDSENINAKNGLAKLDFNYEGTMVDCEIKNGQFISLEIYANIYKA